MKNEEVRALALKIGKEICQEFSSECNIDCSFESPLWVENAIVVLRSLLKTHYLVEREAVRYQREQVKKELLSGHKAISISAVGRDLLLDKLFPEENTD